MTCVWDGLIKALHKKCTPQMFVIYLKKNNQYTPNIICNNGKLTQNQMVENFNRINEIDINKLRQGYDCSAFDPVLFLCSHLFNVNIIHEFHRVKIEYYNPLARQTIKVYSNRGHFWA